MYQLKNFISFSGLIFSCLIATAQNKDLKLKLNEDGSQYLKFTFTSQVWLRYNQSNPGTTVNSFKKSETYDIGLRRVRMQLFGKVSDRVFIYTQFGENNINYLSARKSGAFFHDVAGEYYVTKRSLHLGAGLAAWTGFSRFASPSVATIMGVDAPLFEQTTNDANDQFFRKLSIYAKGKIGRLDYRLILSDPFIVNSGIATVKPISTNSDFAYNAPSLQSSAYLMYQFLDEESNATAYNTGTYLGQKKVFNIGAGFEYQPRAMWNWNNALQKDTQYHDMLHYCVDLYYDAPVNREKGTALHAYAAYMGMNFGPSYIRNLGVMNPADGVKGVSSFNGSGNAYPMMGTGNVIYGQAGFLLPKKLLGETAGQLMPFASFMYADYTRLKSPVTVFDLGLQWQIEGHRSKLGIDWQNRPVFDQLSLKEKARRNMLVLQYQIAI